MDKINDIKSIARILSNARYDSKVSQETMAMELGVSKNTIVNWEKGVSQPDIVETLQWFKVCGKNPMPPLLEFIYPGTFDGINPETEDEKIKHAVYEVIDSLPPKSTRQLAYLFFGAHQSSPISILEMMTAHLHNNIRARVVTARTIVDNYDMNLARHDIVCEENIKPDMDLLNKSIELAKEAYIDGKSGYSSNIFSYTK